MAEGPQSRPELVRRAIIIPVPDDCKIVLYDLLETLDEQLVKLDTGREQQIAALNLIAHLVHFTGCMVLASQSEEVLPSAPIPAR